MKRSVADLVGFVPIWGGPYYRRALSLVPLTTVLVGLDYDRLSRRPLAVKFRIEAVLDHNGPSCGVG